MTRPSKWQEIIVTVIGCLVLAGLVSGGVYWFVNSRDDSPASKQDARGYTLTPPEGWTRVNPAPQGTSVAFASPAEDTDATGKLKPFITVQSAALNKQSQTASFKAIADSYIKQLGESYDDYQFVSVSDQTVGGNPAKLVTFTSKGETAAVTTMSLFTVKDGISYAVNGEALTSVWLQQAARIEQSLLTFRP